MFIPLHDTNPPLRYPTVTYGLIVTNVIMFLLTLSMPGMEVLGFWKATWFDAPSLGIIQLFTYQFIHGGFGHLAFNLWFLYIFGDNVEGSLGHGVFLVFYLLCGVGAALTEVYLDPFFGVQSPGVLVGASGAISGVLGAYAVRYPRARVLTWVFFFFFWEIPAGWFIGAWIVSQFLYQLSAAGGNVAYMSHIGGFICGLVLYYLYHNFKLSRRP